MKELLTRDVSVRLGVGEAGFKKLQRHPWLKHICWDILGSKAIGAPFVPDVRIYKCLAFIFAKYFNM